MVNKRIAFQGELGAYSEEALLLLHPGAVSQPHREFRDVSRAVLEGRADLGILPIENSLVGSIATNFDLIAESGLAIVGEVVSAVHHCLLGVPGAKRGGLRRGVVPPGGGGGGGGVPRAPRGGGGGGGGCTNGESTPRTPPPPFIFFPLFFFIKKKKKI